MLERVIFRAGSALTEVFLSANRNPGADSLPDKANNINNSGNFYFQVIMYLAAVILIIAGLFYFRKYFLNRLGRARNGTYIKIVDSLVIGPDKQIILIETGNKILIVGITQQRMETLAEFSKEEFGTLNKSEDENGGNKNNDFMSVLRGRLNFKNSGKNGNDNGNEK